jgi:hypothetical protein
VCALVNAEVDDVLTFDRCETCKTEQHYAHLADVITRYCSQGYIDSLPKELFRRAKMSALDYQQCCLALQARHLTKYRHFLFLTGNVNDMISITVIPQYIVKKMFTCTGRFDPI